MLLAYAAALQGFDEAHGVPHTVRVLCNALRIAEAEGDVDLDVVVAAAILHDVGRGAEEQLGLHHALVSAALARLLLPSLGFSGDRVDLVIRAVLEHSFSIGGKPSVKESCVVSDADKLDALGALGFVRAAIVTGETGRPLGDMVTHFYEKLARLPELMCTGTARREARRRLNRLWRMMAWLEEEMLDYEDAVAQALDLVLTRLSGGRGEGGPGGGEAG